MGPGGTVTNASEPDPLSPSSGRIDHPGDGRPRRGRPPELSLDLIADAGFAVGLAGVSLAAVAEHLGVTPNALYRYVASRTELERLLVRRVLQLGYEWLPTGVGRTDAEYLLDIAQAIRLVELAFPGYASFVAGLEGGPEGAVDELRESMDKLESVLVARGYAGHDALHLVATVGNVALDLATREAKNPANPLYGAWSKHHIQQFLGALPNADRRQFLQVTADSYFERVMTPFIDRLLARRADAPWNRTTSSQHDA